jgi:Leucine-rich repeat (LRR) protein
VVCGGVAGDTSTYISSIEGAQYLTNITALWLEENNIVDVTPLGHLTNLTSLYLGFNQISDVTPLAGLINLAWVDLDNNKISDISSLSALPAVNGSCSSSPCQLTASGQVVELPAAVAGTSVTPIVGTTSLPITLTVTTGPATVAPNGTTVIYTGVDMVSLTWQALETTTGSTFSGTAISLPSGTPANAALMYRLYNPNSGEHFYTADTVERDGLIALGWSLEGIGWTAPVTSSAPVYRLYNPNAGDHFYTLSASERDSLVAVGWNYEGIGWYSETDPTLQVPVYRAYNPNAIAGAHNFTTSLSEQNHLVSVGWRNEGIAWYGVS